MRRSRAALAVLFGLTSSVLVPMGSREEPRLRPEEAVGAAVVVCGRIALYGNEPHTYVGLLARPDDQRDCPNEASRSPARRLLLEDELVFRATGELADELVTLQGRRAAVVGELVSAGTPPAPPPLVRVQSYSLLAGDG